MHRPFRPSAAVTVTVPVGGLLLFAGIFLGVGIAIGAFIRELGERED